VLQHLYAMTGGPDKRSHHEFQVSFVTLSTVEGMAQRAPGRDRRRPARGPAGACDPNALLKPLRFAARLQRHLAHVSLQQATGFDTACPQIAVTPADAIGNTGSTLNATPTALPVRAA
jgi:hypothetical protein